MRFCEWKAQEWMPQILPFPQRAIGGVASPIFLPTPTTIPIAARHARARRRHENLSYEEMERLFAAIPDTPQDALYRALFLTYFWAGQRKSEILPLTWGDLFEGMMIEME